MIMSMYVQRPPLLCMASGDYMLYPRWKFVARLPVNIIIHFGFAEMKPLGLVFDLCVLCQMGRDTTLKYFDHQGFQSFCCQ